METQKFFKSNMTKQKANDFIKANSATIDNYRAKYLLIFDKDKERLILS